MGAEETFQVPLPVFLNLPLSNSDELFNPLKACATPGGIVPAACSGPMAGPDYVACAEHVGLRLCSRRINLL